MSQNKSNNEGENQAFKPKKFHNLGAVIKQALLCTKYLMLGEHEAVLQMMN